MERERFDDVVRFVETYIKPVTLDARIIQAFLQVPRRLFIPYIQHGLALENCSIPIGYGQTTSQPSLIAHMIELLRLTPNDIVLEIGTGSGYQTALLSLLVKHVYSVERIPELAQQAKSRLLKYNYSNITIEIGNGTLGLPHYAPFDAITVGAVGPGVPQPLKEQLRDGGRIVMPVASKSGHGSRLLFGIKKNKALEVSFFEQVAFVPLVGKHGVQ